MSHEDAILHAETEFEKYRIIQDHLFESDFDKYLDELPFDEEQIWPYFSQHSLCL